MFNSLLLNAGFSQVWHQAARALCDELVILGERMRLWASYFSACARGIASKVTGDENGRPLRSRIWRLSWPFAMTVALFVAAMAEESLWYRCHAQHA